MLLQFLTVVLPQVPNLAKMFRDAFTKIGGDPAEFDKILADNQIQIDRLANPDSFRHKPGTTPTPPAPPTPTPPTGFELGVVMDADPGDDQLENGWVVYQSDNDATKFVVDDAKIGGARPPNDVFPPPGGWKEIRTVSK